MWPERRVTLPELERAERLSELLGQPVDLVPKAGLKPLVRAQVLASARQLHAA